MKQKIRCDFHEYVARDSREAASLCYCGLGTAIKMSAIPFNDNKNLELLRGLPWPCQGFGNVFGLSPKMKKQCKKFYTAISAKNLAASILHRNAFQGCPQLKGLTRMSAIIPRIRTEEGEGPTEGKRRRQGQGRGDQQTRRKGGPKPVDCVSAHLEGRNRAPRDAWVRGTHFLFTVPLLFPPQ
jgi:hypothetical protein